MNVRNGNKYVIRIQNTFFRVSKQPVIYIMTSSRHQGKDMMEKQMESTNELPQKEMCMVRVDHNMSGLVSFSFCAFFFFFFRFFFS